MPKNTVYSHSLIDRVVVALMLNANERYYLRVLPRWHKGFPPHRHREISSVLYVLVKDNPAQPGVNKYTRTVRDVTWSQTRPGLTSIATHRSVSMLLHQVALCLNDIFTTALWILKADWSEAVVSFSGRFFITRKSFKNTDVSSFLVIQRFFFSGKEKPAAVIRCL